jgi:hypothetical protein
MHAAAARFDDVAFTADPALADDLKVGRRGQAAASAVLAGTGKGRDAGGLDDAQKAGLRKLALGWLKADLAARAKQPPAERAAVLRRWLADEALAGVRGAEALAALPRTERGPWEDFWAAVRERLREEGGD